VSINDSVTTSQTRQQKLRVTEFEEVRLGDVTKQRIDIWAT